MLKKLLPYKTTKIKKIIKIFRLKFITIILGSKKQKVRLVNRKKNILEISTCSNIFLSEII